MKANPKNYQFTVTTTFLIETKLYLIDILWICLIEYESSILGKSHTGIRRHFPSIESLVYFYYREDISLVL